VRVKYTTSEILHAYLVAGQRQAQDLIENRKPIFGVGNDCWTANISGALGELALAKATGKYWSGALGDFRADDVGTFQARATFHANGGLRLYPKDDDDKFFFLIRIDGLIADVYGYMRCRKGKLDQFWKEEWGCWLVPAEMLKPYKPTEYRE